MIQTLEWTDQGVRFIDQTKLPTEETYVTCKTSCTGCRCHPQHGGTRSAAIGVAAAMGIALGVRDSKAETVGDLKRDLDLICDNMSKTGLRQSSILGHPPNAGEVRAAARSPYRANQAGTG